MSRKSISTSSQVRSSSSSRVRVQRRYELAHAAYIAHRRDFTPPKNRLPGMLAKAFVWTLI